MNRFMATGLMAIALTTSGAIAACQSQSTTETSSDDTAATAETSEESPVEAPEPESLVRSGTFVPGEHDTAGAAELTQTESGFIVTFSDDFQTVENAPDPFVVLHTSEDVIGSTEPPAFPLQESDYVEIAPLKSSSGAQEYVIPAEVDIDEYASVVVWCREFNASFASAQLQ